MGQIVYIIESDCEKEPVIQDSENTKKISCRNLFTLGRLSFGIHMVNFKIDLLFLSNTVCIFIPY